MNGIIVTTRPPVGAGGRGFKCNKLLIREIVIKGLTIRRLGNIIISTIYVVLKLIMPLAVPIPIYGKWRTQGFFVFNAGG